NDTIIVEDNTFVFENSGVSLEPLKAKKVKEAVDIECTVEESTDFCFAGHVSFEEEKTIDVFAVENMTENRLFEGLKDYESFGISGAKAGLVGIIDSTQQTVPVAGIVADDGSGFFFTIRD